MAVSLSLEGGRYFVLWPVDSDGVTPLLLMPEPVVSTDQETAVGNEAGGAADDSVTDLSSPGQRVVRTLESASGTDEPAPSNQGPPDASLEFSSTEEPSTASTREPTTASTEEPTTASTEEPSTASTEEATTASTEEQLGAGRDARAGSGAYDTYTEEHQGAGTDARAGSGADDAYIEEPFLITGSGAEGKGRYSSTLQGLDGLGASGSSTRKDASRLEGASNNSSSSSIEGSGSGSSIKQDLSSVEETSRRSSSSIEGGSVLSSSNGVEGSSVISSSSGVQESSVVGIPVSTETDKGGVNGSRMQSGSSSTGERGDSSSTGNDSAQQESVILEGEDSSGSSSSMNSSRYGNRLRGCVIDPYGSGSLLEVSEVCVCVCVCVCMCCIKETKPRALKQ